MGGALAGMITGAATISVVKNYIKIDGEYFYELLPGFFLAFIAIILIMFSREEFEQPAPAPEMETEPETEE